MFRLLQEDKVSTSSCFVTLTYDTEFVPITEKGFMTLRKSDVQKWIKRLRKTIDSRIKYYLVGEYGPKTLRPHYHAILFNTDGNTVVDTWRKGNIVIGDVSGASVSYTAGYISKPGPRIPLHAGDDRSPQFSLMSKGLGKNYLSDGIVDWHLADVTRNYVVQDGFKIPLPRYYRKKLPYTEEQRMEIENIASMMQGQREKEEFEEISEKYPLKAYMDYKFEKIEHFKEFEKFLKRKL